MHVTTIVKWLLCALPIHIKHALSMVAVIDLTKQGEVGDLTPSGILHTNMRTCPMNYPVNKAHWSQSTN